jgi:4-(gamma-glutamylamino)butanal dehydrogenase
LAGRTRKRLRGRRLNSEANLSNAKSFGPSRAQLWFLETDVSEPVTFMTTHSSPVPDDEPTLSARDLAAISPLVDGRAMDSKSPDRMPTYDPSSGKVLDSIPVGCTADAVCAVQSARSTFQAGVWRHLPPSARKAALHRWADLIASHAAKLNALDALEMGKPVRLPVFDAASAAGFVRFNAEAIDKVRGEVLTSDSGSSVLQARMPRGVVAAIVPWNFPTYNAVLKVAPALAAGNSVVLKPSELACQSAFRLVQLALEAGIPPGVFNMVPGRGEIVGRALGENMDVDMVTFTGSSAVGKLMLRYAGDSNMKVVSAECGGKSPHIVFDDGIDLDVVARQIAAGICLNQGQVCSVGSRLLVQDAIEEALVQRIIERVEDIVVGNPLHRTTTYGPLVSSAQRDKVLAFIESGKRDGADLVHGGVHLLPESGGYFVSPAIFVNVPAESSIARDEIFGPVLSVQRFRDIGEAISLAHATAYGLAAYVWTTRLDTGFKLSGALQTALTLVSATAVSGEGPAFAFSGEPSGLSGTGVEGGLAGLESYMRRQTTWFSHG